MLLRALEPEDLDILYQVENNSDEWAVSTANMPYSRQLLREYILNSTGDIYTDKQVRLMVEAKEVERNVTVGIIDLFNFNPEHSRAEVGVYILPEYRGKGYGSRTLQQLVSYATTKLHIHQLYAIIPVSNTVSQQLFYSAGFTTIATLPQWLRTQGGFSDAIIQHLIIK